MFRIVLPIRLKYLALLLNAMRSANVSSFTFYFYIPQQRQIEGVPKERPTAI